MSLFFHQRATTATTTTNITATTANTTTTTDTAARTVEFFIKKIEKPQDMPSLLTQKLGFSTDLTALDCHDN